MIELEKGALVRMSSGSMMEQTDHPTTASIKA
jgi:hypothetical protein